MPPPGDTEEVIVEDASDDEQEDDGGVDEMLHDGVIDMFGGVNGNSNATAAAEFVRPPDKSLRHSKLGIARERRKMKAKARAAAKDGDMDVANMITEAMELDLSTFEKFKPESPLGVFDFLLE